MEVTISIFEETEATNEDGELIPGLEAEYTLKGYRWGPPGVSVVFQDQTFLAEDAYEVTGKVCHALHQIYFEMDGTECEDDSDCYGGFCAVAYRYKVTEHCPLYRENSFYDGNYWYTIRTSSGYDLFNKGSGLGSSNWFETQEVIGTLCDFEFALNDDEEQPDEQDTEETGDTDDTQDAEDQTGDSDCSISQVGNADRAFNLFQALLRLTY